MLLDALQIKMVGELGIESLEVELDRLRVLAQRVRLEVLLVLEQPVMHLPELSLRARGLRGFGGNLGVGMRRDDRKMAEGETDATPEMLEHDLDAVIRLRAHGTFEIPVFDDDDARVRSAEDVIDRASAMRRDFLTVYDCSCESLSCFSGVVAALTVAEAAMTRRISYKTPDGTQTFVRWALMRSPAEYAT